MASPRKDKKKRSSLKETLTVNPLFGKVNPVLMKNAVLLEATRGSKKAWHTSHITEAAAASATATPESPHDGSQLAEKAELTAPVPKEQDAGIDDASPRSQPSKTKPFGRPRSGLETSKGAISKEKKLDAIFASLDELTDVDTRPRLRKFKSEVFIHSWDYMPVLNYLKTEGKQSGSPASPAIALLVEEATASASPSGGRERGRSRAGSILETLDLYIATHKPPETISPPPSPVPLLLESTLAFVEKDGMKIVESGTVDDLIVMLTSYASQTHNDFIFSFLATHTYVIDSVALFEKLKYRYMNPPTDDNLPAEAMAAAEVAATSTEERLQITRLRVVNVLKKWLEDNFHFFEKNSQLKEKAQQFIEECLEQKQPWAIHLKRLLERTGSERRTGGAAGGGPPREDLIPLLPVNMLHGKISFLDLHPLEVARQLTLAEAKLLQAIQPTELFKCAWSKSGKSTTSPNVLAMTERFNKISYWIAGEIVTTANPGQRVEVLSRFVQLAEYLLGMQNFNGVMQVYCALNLGCIQRLKTTWKALPKKYLTKLAELEELMESSNNYHNYRDLIDTLSPPLIPFQAVLLLDLTYIEELPTLLRRDAKARDGTTLPIDVVNCEKVRLLGRVLADLLRCQRSHYPFYEVLPIQNFLNNVPILSEKELYEKAKLCEQLTADPKEKALTRSTSSKSFYGSLKINDKPANWLSVMRAAGVEDLKEEDRQLKKKMKERLKEEKKLKKEKEKLEKKKKKEKEKAEKLKAAEKPPPDSPREGGPGRRFTIF